MFDVNSLFDSRNIIKKRLEILKKKNYPKTMSIWYVRLWRNVWFEENGKLEFFRPVLVIRKIWNLYFCIPLTTKWKKWYYYYKLLNKYNWKQSWLLLSQWRVLDSKRFVSNIGILDDNEFLGIKKLLKNVYLWKV